VRFAYLPLDTDRFNHPRIIRAVKEGDIRLQESPLQVRSGFTIFVTEGELRALAKAITQAPLEWTNSDSSAKFEWEPKDKDNPLFTPGKFHLSIKCPAAFCSAHETLDGACRISDLVSNELQTKRAIWEWKYFAKTMGCSVRDFDPSQFSH
jgi:hypothetical protein